MEDFIDCVLKEAKKQKIGFKELDIRKPDGKRIGPSMISHLLSGERRMTLHYALGFCRVLGLRIFADGYMLHTISRENMEKIKLIERIDGLKELLEGLSQEKKGEKKNT